MSKNSVEVLAANVIRLRIRKKWSPADLAFHARMSEKGIRNIEDCVTCSSLTVLDALAKAFQVTPATLLRPKK